MPRGITNKFNNSLKHSDITNCGGDSQECDNDFFSWSFQINVCENEKNPILGGNKQSSVNMMLNPEKPNKYLGVQKKELLDIYELDLKVKHRKKNTVNRYFSSAKKFLNFVEETKGTISIDETVVKKYVVHINNKDEPNSVTSNIQGMDKFLDYLGLSELRIPIPDWKSIRRDTITIDEIDKIRQLAKEKYTLDEYLFVLFTTEFDCRPGEIAKAKWSWIKGNKIYFEDCKTPDAPGFISEELQRTLNEWKEQSKRFKRKDNSYIFFNTQGRYKGEPLSLQTWKIRELINKISLEAIGREINPTDLKASVITEEFNNRINPKVIQAKARHQSWKTTARYNHSDEKDLEKYVSEGMIFGENIETISKKAKDKRSCI